MNNQLIELLKEARLNSGLRQQDVAEKLGIKNNTLSNWERGRNEPDIDTFIKMCEIYGVDSVSLLERSYRLESKEYTMHEKSLISAYRKNQSVQSAVDKLLDIEPECETVHIFRAASSQDHSDAQVLDVPKETIDRFKAARAVQSDDDI